MTKYHNYEIQPGYVEDSRLCIMRVGHDEGFDSIEAAMEHFRLTLVSYLKSQRQAPEEECCRTVLANKKPPKGLVWNFCPTCGTRLGTLSEVTPYEVQDLFLKMPMMTADETGGNGIYDHFQNAGWTLGCCHEGFPTVTVQAVDRWMGRDIGDEDGCEDERPWMEGQYPDGSSWNSRD